MIPLQQIGSEDLSYFSCNCFQKIQNYMISIHQHHRQTDGQTDDLQ